LETPNYRNQSSLRHWSALLYLLDCLIFYDIVDETKVAERQKTYMFDLMKKMIQAQKIKTMDIIEDDLREKYREDGYSWP
tara:strand:- start:304 stop:543 length:240 start_codon:yes stop_codon:yes gene_type:complete